jgi:hypothetical protein
VPQTPPVDTISRHEPCHARPHIRMVGTAGSPSCPAAHRRERPASRDRDGILAARTAMATPSASGVPNSDFISVAPRARSRRRAPPRGARPPCG